MQCSLCVASLQNMCAGCVVVIVLHHRQENVRPIETRLLFLTRSCLLCMSLSSLVCFLVFVSAILSLCLSSLGLSCLGVHSCAHVPLFLMRFSSLVALPLCSSRLGTLSVLFCSIPTRSPLYCTNLFLALLLGALLSFYVCSSPPLLYSGAFSLSLVLLSPSPGTPLFLVPCLP